MLVPLVTRRVYDFSASAGSTVDVVAVRFREVLAYRGGELLVRVHAVSIASPRTMSVIAYKASPSPDRPDLDFYDPTAWATASVTSAAAGDLVKTQLAAGFGSHLRVIVRAVPDATPGNLSATLSIALAMRPKPS
jgi:hypothetical protein